MSALNKSKYIPKPGDIVWINFDPQAGREEAKRRPALILSPKEYNAKTSLCILCPLTSKQKGYPFEVVVRSGKNTSIILSDHVKSLDWHAREATFKEKVSKAILQDVLAKLSVLLQVPHH